MFRSSITSAVTLLFAGRFLLAYAGGAHNLGAFVLMALWMRCHLTMGSKYLAHLNAVRCLVLGVVYLLIVRRLRAAAAAATPPSCVRYVSYCLWYIVHSRVLTSSCYRAPRAFAYYAARLSSNKRMLCWRSTPPSCWCFLLLCAHRAVTRAVRRRVAEKHIALYHLHAALCHAVTLRARRLPSRLQQFVQLTGGRTILVARRRVRSLALSRPLITYASCGAILAHI